MGRSAVLGSRGGAALRPGGQLLFLVNSFCSCSACARRRRRGHRPAPAPPRSECTASNGRAISASTSISRTATGSRLLRGSGFEVEDLIEVRPPEGATTRYPFVTLEWSRRWPCEEVWKARKRAYGEPTLESCATVGNLRTRPPRVGGEPSGALQKFRLRLRPRIPRRLPLFLKGRLFPPNEEPNGSSEGANSCGAPGDP